MVMVHILLTLLWRKLTSSMTKLLGILQENPTIGALTTVIAFMSTLIENTTPIIQWVSGVVFLSIGIVTLVLKIKELLNKGDK